MQRSGRALLITGCPQPQFRTIMRSAQIEKITAGKLACMMMIFSRCIGRSPFSEMQRSGIEIGTSDGDAERCIGRSPFSEMQRSGIEIGTSDGDAERCIGRSPFSEMQRSGIETGTSDGDAERCIGRSPIARCSEAESRQALRRRNTGPIGQVFQTIRNQD